MEETESKAGAPEGTAAEAVQAEAAEAPRAETAAAPQAEAAVPQAHTRAEAVEPQAENAPDAEKEAAGAAEDEELTRYVRRALRQAEALRALYPDIDAMFRDREFLALTSPEVGLDLRTAYEIVRRRASPAARPAESGARYAAGAVPAADPSRLSKEERAEIRRRVKAGDRSISF